MSQELLDQYLQQTQNSGIVVYQTYPNIQSANPRFLIGKTVHIEITYPKLPLQEQELDIHVTSIRKFYAKWLKTTSYVIRGDDLHSPNTKHSIGTDLPLKITLAAKS
jgi:hypothetical protein